MHNEVPTTCFGRFLTGHHQVGIQCQRNYILTISTDISISVRTHTNTDYMFRPFPNWPSSGWNTMSEELYTYYKYRHQY